MNSQKNNSNGLLSLTSSINQDELKKITPSLFKYIFFPLERYIKEIMVLDQNTSQYDIMKKISWRISGDINIKDGVSIDEINMTLKNYKGQHLFGVLELQESDERIRNDYLILLGPQKRVNKHNYVFINDYLIFNRETLKNLMIIIRNLKGGAIIYISGINVGITIDKNSELEEIYDQVVPIGQKEEIYKNNIILKTIKEMICGETLIKKEAVQNHDVLKHLDVHGDNVNIDDADDDDDDDDDDNYSGYESDFIDDRCEEDMSEDSSSNDAYERDIDSIEEKIDDIS